MAAREILGVSRLGAGRNDGHRGEFPGAPGVDPPMELLAEVLVYLIWAAIEFRWWRRISLFCRSRIWG